MLISTSPRSIAISKPAILSNGILHEHRDARSLSATAGRLLVEIALGTGYYQGEAFGGLAAQADVQRRLVLKSNRDEGLCLWHPTQHEIGKIRAAMPAGTEVVVPAETDYLSRYETTYDGLEPHARDADAFIGWTIPAGILEVAERLKFLSWLHVGVDDLRQIGAFTLLARRGAKLANIAGANAIAIAEQGMMLMLALAKNAIVKHQMAVEGRSSFPVWGARTDRRCCRDALSA